MINGCKWAIRSSSGANVRMLKKQPTYLRRIQMINWGIVCSFQIPSIGILITLEFLVNWIFYFQKNVYICSLLCGNKEFFISKLGEVKVDVNNNCTNWCEARCRITSKLSVIKTYIFQEYRGKYFPIRIHDKEIQICFTNKSIPNKVSVTGPYL